MVVVHAYVHIAILLYNKLLIHESVNTVIRIYYNTVFFITATRVKDPMEFTLPKYKKVK